jgi:hypothetical protein
MPMFGPGISVSLMLCPAYAPVPPAIGATADAAADASMDMPGMDMSMQEPIAAHAGQSGRPDHQEHTLCPYAASATLASPPNGISLCPSERPVANLPLLTPQVAYFRLPHRAQSARAPPLLAT